MVAADELVEKLDGVGQRFISCLPYLKDRNRYNVMSPRLIEGIEIVFEIGIPRSGLFRERYKVYNELANTLRQKCRLKP